MRCALLLTAGWFLCVPFAVHAAAATQPLPAEFDSNFIQVRTLPGFSTPLVSRGRVRINGAHGLLWEIISPYHYMFEMNGDEVQEQLPDGTTRHLNPAQTPWLAAVERIFMSALAGNRSDLSRYFEVHVKQLPKGQSIMLTPKPGPMASAIRSIQVMESAPGHPQRLVIREISGGSMDIRFDTEPIPASGSS